MLARHVALASTLLIAVTGCTNARRCTAAPEPPLYPPPAPSPPVQYDHPVSYFEPPPPVTATDVIDSLRLRGIAVRSFVHTEPEGNSRTLVVCRGGHLQMVCAAASVRPVLQDIGRELEALYRHGCDVRSFGYTVDQSKAPATSFSNGHMIVRRSAVPQ